jgi:hypothetical protein
MGNEIVWLGDLNFFWASQFGLGYQSGSGYQKSYLSVPLFFIYIPDRELTRSGIGVLDTLIIPY